MIKLKLNMIKETEVVDRRCGFWEIVTDQNNSIQENEKYNSSNCDSNCTLLKWNRYNYIKRNSDNEFLLFNCSTNNHMYMVKEVKDLLVGNIKTLNKLELIHPTLFYFLINKKFVVSKDFDEVKDAIKQMEQNLNSLESFELHINPTLECNLNCWYCYEIHQKGSIVNNDMLNAIMSFIKNKVEFPQLKKITLSFFGGEPLLKFNEVIWPLIKYTQEICMQNKKQLYLFFNTNGVLLTKKIINRLYSTGLSCNFQVPFDGNEEYHNKIKKFANGKGTFDIIVNNIMYALSRGFRFSIRCNYTSENLHTFEDLISLFRNYADECIKYRSLTFSYHKVWQIKHTEEMNYFVSKYEKETNMSQTNFYQCYADRENSVVINYNGDVFNCTANDFRTEDREGYLNSKGEIVYNEKHRKRMEIRFSSKNCQNCMIFPICTICTKTKLELQSENLSCFRFLSEEAKERLLLEKIQATLNI